MKGNNYATLDQAFVQKNAVFIKPIVDTIDPSESKDQALSYYLIAAAASGQKDMVSALLSAGANVNGTEPQTGYTALHRAARNGDIAMVGLLVTSGADISALTKGNNTPAQLAQRELTRPENELAKNVRTDLARLAANLDRLEELQLDKKIEQAKKNAEENNKMTKSYVTESWSADSGVGRNANISNRENECNDVHHSKREQPSAEVAPKIRTVC